MTTRKSFRLPEPETHGTKSDGEAVAVLEGLRASALQAELRALRRHVSLIQNSRSWKLTRPLRWGNALFRGRLPGGMQLSRLTRHFAMTRQEYGLMAAGREIADNLRTLIADIGRARRSTDLFGACSDSERAVYALLPTPPSKVLRPRFLIIATLDLPQCVKYRVDQKAGMLRATGWDVCIVDWNDVCSAMSALQMASEVIFYRTPATADILALIDESRRLGLSPRWEVDDLIFDEAAYRANGNLAALTRREKLHLLDDSALYKECLLACGRGLASTPALAKAMRDVGVQDVVVIENALDEETLATAQALAVSHLPNESDRIVIFYGSGSRAHDVDFLEAEEGLIAAMRADSRLCLHVVGSVRLSVAFAAFGTRVRHTDAMPYRRYLAELAQADISITPLEPSLFNDAKSTIRFIEASIVGLPSVCSPTASYADIIVDGSNGFLAKDSRSWADRLLRLARDPALRRGLAEAGRHSVLDRYSPGRIIEDQIVPAYGRPALLQRESQLRVVMPNVFFAPRSFGGATVVVESLVDPLAICGCEVSVLTTRASIRGVPDGALRYHAKGVDVLAAVPGMKASVFNADIGDDLACWIDAWDADIVHFHAIQELGMGMARTCLEKNVPYVVTLHDCWWLADDLFIRKDDGSYQLVTPDDEKTPSRSPHDVYLDARRVLSYEVLMNAALLLSPSEEHKALYVRNGIPAERIVINRNGFRWPERPHRRRDVSAPLRFGYVGGASAVKGYDLIHEALSALSRSDWELVLVDNTLNVGFPSIDPSKWKDVAGTVTIVPAYTQDGLDDFYDTVDVLLFPSQWRESYGLSVREALSRDVWVIATTPGGQAEEIVEGVNGNLIPLDTTPQDLQGAILALLERPEAFTGYHNPLKSRLPTYTRQAEELYALYREILNRKSNAGLG